MQCMSRHEDFLALKLNLSANQVCLDVGCGVGGPMREIAKISGARVVGLNNNDYQVKRCGYLAKKTGLESVVSAVKVCRPCRRCIYQEMIDWWVHLQYVGEFWKHAISRRDFWCSVCHWGHLSLACPWKPIQGDFQSVEAWWKVCLLWVAYHWQVWRKQPGTQANHSWFGGMVSCIEFVVGCLFYMRTHAHACRKETLCLNCTLSPCV